MCSIKLFQTSNIADTSRVMLIHYSIVSQSNTQLHLPDYYFANDRQTSSVLGIEFHSRIWHENLSFLATYFFAMNIKKIWKMIRSPCEWDRRIKNQISCYFYRKWISYQTKMNIELLIFFHEFQTVKSKFSNFDSTFLNQRPRKPRSSKLRARRAKFESILRRSKEKKCESRVHVRRWFKNKSRQDGRILKIIGWFWTMEFEKYKEAGHDLRR